MKSIFVQNIQKKEILLPSHELLVLYDFMDKRATKWPESKLV